MTVALGDPDRERGRFGPMRLGPSWPPRVPARTRMTRHPGDRTSRRLMLPIPDARPIRTHEIARTATSVDNTHDREKHIANGPHVGRLQTEFSIDSRERSQRAGYPAASRYIAHAAREPGNRSRSKRSRR